MKKAGILNNAISEVIASMGHYHRLVVCDAGFPIPLNVQRIDLAVITGLPRFMDVLKAVVNELQIEQAYIAEETDLKSPHRLHEMLDVLPADSEKRVVPHEEFKEMSKEAVACIRTGECTPYSNIILVSGVTY